MLAARRQGLSTSARNCYLFQNACIGVSAASAAILFSAGKLSGREGHDKLAWVYEHKEVGLGLGLAFADCSSV